MKADKVDKAYLEATIQNMDDQEPLNHALQKVNVDEETGIWLADEDDETYALTQGICHMQNHLHVQKELREGKLSFRELHIYNTMKHQVKLTEENNERLVEQLTTSEDALRAYTNLEHRIPEAPFRTHAEQKRLAVHYAKLKHELGKMDLISESLRKEITFLKQELAELEDMPN